MSYLQGLVMIELSQLKKQLGQSLCASDSFRISKIALIVQSTDKAGSFYHFLSCGNVLIHYEMYDM